MTLFDPGVPAEQPRPVSADARRTARHLALLEAGRHPATMARLAGNGETCGTCRFARRYHHRARWYWKCTQHRLGESHSAASDIRKGWPACELWGGV